MIRLDIVMEDGSELKDVNIFYNKELGDSMIRNRYDFESAMSANKPSFLVGNIFKVDLYQKELRVTNI